MVGFALQGLEPGPRWGQYGFIDVGSALVIGLAGWIGAPLGARMAERLGSDRLRRVFGLLLLLVALRMAL